MRRGWMFAVPLLALLAFAVRLALSHRSPPSPASPALVAPAQRLDVGARPVAVAPPAQRSPATDEVDWRARALASPAFSRLPPQDQRWVLAQAQARAQGPDDPRLEQVVRELSEVRVFAVSEREEPLIRPADSR